MPITMKKLFLVLILLFPVMCSAQKYGIKTNIIGLATGSFNIEASVALSNKWTLHFPFSWNPLSIEENYKIKHLVLQPGARWWFWHSYTGYFIGIHVLSAIYNIGVNDFRYQGWAAGAAVSGGYSFMLSRRWNLETEIGIGACWCEYDIYERPICGEYESSVNKLIIGPSRISIAIVYIF